MLYKLYLNGIYDGLWVDSPNDVFNIIENYVTDDNRKYSYIITEASCYTVDEYMKYHRRDM